MDHVNSIVAQHRLLLLAKEFTESGLYTEGEPRRFLSTLATKLRELDQRSSKNETEDIQHAMYPRFSNSGHPVLLNFHFTYNRNLCLMPITQLSLSAYGQDIKYTIDPKNQIQLPTVRQLSEALGKMRRLERVTTIPSREELLHPKQKR